MTKTQIGHNSEARQDKIQALAARYAETHKASQELNDERAEIREEVGEMGLDKKAWQDQINRAVQNLKKRDGYDESSKEISDALGQMDMEQLWSHVAERKARKEKEREDRKAAREKEAATNDKYKAAPDRKPKEGKVLKSVGEEQAEAVLSSVGNKSAA